MPFTTRQVDDTVPFPFGGLMRSYDIHVPGGFMRWRRMPLVFVLHGGGARPELAREQSGMNRVADRHGFIVVYPAGTNEEWTDKRLYWHTGRPVKDPSWAADDVGFIAAIIESLRRPFSIDMRRIYAAGSSNGAQMCYRLASDLPVISAIGAVSGHMTVAELRQPPHVGFAIIDFHGKRDRFAPIDGGGIEPEGSPFVPYKIAPLLAAASSWKLYNDCAEPVSTTFGQAECLTFWHRKHDMAFYILGDGGHTWPGGTTTPFERDVLRVGPVSKSVNASDEMAAFFLKHKR